MASSPTPPFGGTRRTVRSSPVTPPPPIKDVLHVLEHDGYLTRGDGGYRFVSGLVEDWWRARNGRAFVPFSRRHA